MAGPSELKLQITISTDKSVLELKQAIAAQSDVDADRQRLIYSGAPLPRPPPVPPTLTPSRLRPSPEGPSCSHASLYHANPDRTRAPPQDDDPLSTYKIQSAHTIHMVKGVSRAAGAGPAAAGAPPQQLPTMHTGQNVHDPLTTLNGHMGFGAMAGFNPFADMGVNPNDPNMVRPRAPSAPRRARANAG